MGGETLLLRDDVGLVERLRAMSSSEKEQSMLVSVCSSISKDEESRLKISYPSGDKNGAYLASEMVKYLSFVKKLRVLSAADTSLKNMMVYGVSVMLVEYEIPSGEIRTSARGKATGQLGWMLARLIQRTVNGSVGEQRKYGRVVEN